MLHICTWSWGDKYSTEYAARLFAGAREHIKQPFIPGLLSPIDEDRFLTQIPGCFARLRLFDPIWQGHLGINPGDRIVCIDLDVVVTGALDDLFDHDDPFAILQGANASNPCPYNGSIWQLRAGYRPDVWSDFSIEAARAVPHDKFPDDQAWFAHKLPDAARWRVGAESGIYAFKKPGWPKGDDLPADARLVCFPGARDPSQFTHIDWVQKNWLRI